MSTAAVPGTGRPKVGVTVGDPAGIGPEIVVKAVADPGLHEQARILVFADRAVLEQALATLAMPLELNPGTVSGEGRFCPGVLDYVEAGILSAPPVAGRVSAAGGRAGYGYLEQGIAAALAGAVDSLATAPLNKESLQAAGVPFIDHTAVLAARAAQDTPMTLFAVRDLRIFFLTRHLSLAQVPGAITGPGLLEAIPRCERYLEQLGIERPTVAVAALNPHGGEQGLFGREEVEIIAPAIAQARQRGCRVVGPIPADAVFHQCLEGRYQGVLALYHDQGHIAAKTVDFHGTVSLTMGLAFLRTSVDHGTAFDIAGQGVADPRGMIAAIQAAARYGSAVRAYPGRAADR
ncbi:MAG: 4-hydroxythreonine-4-phosphate dehydrogenase PdxA [Candidatus Latescibacterota bacterium]